MYRKFTQALVLLIAFSFYASSVVARAQEPNENEVLTWFAQALKHEEAAEFSQAAFLYEKMLKEAPRLWGEDSVNEASILHNLAILRKDMRQYAKAEPLY
jgi:tetratricopeptide (TPR) repeat protein